MMRIRVILAGLLVTFAYSFGMVDLNYKLIIAITHAADIFSLWCAIVMAMCEMLLISKLMTYDTTYKITIEENEENDEED